MDTYLRTMVYVSLQNTECVSPWLLSYTKTKIYTEIWLDISCLGMKAHVWNMRQICRIWCLQAHWHAGIRIGVGTGRTFEHVTWHNSVGRSIWCLSQHEHWLSSSISWEARAESTSIVAKYCFHEISPNNGSPFESPICFISEYWDQWWFRNRVAILVLLLSLRKK